MSWSLCDIRWEAFDAARVDAGVLALVFVDVLAALI